MLFQQAGVRIIAVSDSQGAITADNGLDLPTVLKHKAAKKTVVGSPGTKTITNAELLTLDCDILIPAAMECQIRADNVDQIRTRFVVEAANGPTTPRADKILFARGIPVLPDILVNGRRHG